jgi:hypothetical protein
MLLIYPGIDIIDQISYNYLIFYLLTKCVYIYDVGRLWLA